MTTSTAHSQRADIVLATINARWAHASFGLRALQANLGALADRSVILERTLEHRAVDVVEAILAFHPRVVGLGVYVWNAAAMLDVVRALKKVRPELLVVLGGPEVSHEQERQEICALADIVVGGEGEDAFREICERTLAPARSPEGGGPARGGARGALVVVDAAAQTAKVVRGGRPDLATLRMPYALYDDVDLQDRVVYVEASRGCPFTCSFCLSALDDAVRVCPLAAFLDEMDRLLERGLRRFKFVDRTFNIKIDDAVRILDFFYERHERLQSLGHDDERGGLFLHFEMIPDRLPLPLRERLARFPAGTVQLEVGIQTFDDATAARIRRKQDCARLEDNLRFLAEHTGVHVHADLIAGLPGEDLASFGRGFDRLLALGPTEIQIGILKRLRGAPLAADVVTHPEWGIVFDDSPPYTILQSAALPFEDVQRISRFARAMDLVSNSGRFPRASLLLFGASSSSSASATAHSPFLAFLAFSDWLFASAGTRHGIALARLAELVTRYLVDVRGLSVDVVTAALEADLGRDRLPNVGGRGALPKRQARAAHLE